MRIFSSLFILNIVSFNDAIFTGGSENDGNYLSDILRYTKNHTWEEVGQMKEERLLHAVAVLEDVSQLCP